MGLAHAASCCPQTAADDSLRRIFELPPSGVLHTALDLRPTQLPSDDQSREKALVVAAPDE